MVGMVAMPGPQVPAPLVCQSIGQVYEWAQIYATERQTLLKKIDETPKAAEDEPLPPGKRFAN